MIKYLVAILAFVAAVPSAGQHFRYPAIPSAGKSIGAFIPHGWGLLDSSFGDLNKDGRIDAALVLQHRDSVAVINDSEDTVLAQPRVLLILFRNAGSDSFKLAERSDRFILMHDEPNMDDPYSGIKITNGLLQLDFGIFYSMGSWFTSRSVYKFRYQSGQFQLIGADYHSINRATLDYEEYSYNFLTLKRQRKAGNEEQQTEKVSWKKLEPMPLKNFSTFSKPFTWDVDEQVVL